MLVHGMGRPHKGKKTQRVKTQSIVEASTNNLEKQPRTSGRVYIPLKPPLRSYQSNSALCAVCFGCAKHCDQWPPVRNPYLTESEALSALTANLIADFKHPERADERDCITVSGVIAHGVPRGYPNNTPKAVLLTGVAMNTGIRRA